MKFCLDYDCKYFTTLDCATGFWQVPLEEDSKPVTAFEMSGELYEFNVMPFGLCNAPSSFQRLMNIVLAGLADVPYIDDIVIATETAEENLRRLREIMTYLRNAGLKMNPKKCEIMRDSIKYLGRIVDASGIYPDPQQAESI